MKRYPFDFPPFPPDLFTIPAEDRARLRDALRRRIVELHRTAGEIANVGAPKWTEYARRPLLDEAAAIGILLDVLTDGG